MVVRDITARAQHALNRAAFDLGFEHWDHQIEYGRATCRQQDLVIAPQVLCIDLLDQRLHTAHQAAHGLDVVGTVAFPQTSLVTLHATQTDNWRGGHGLCQQQCLFVGATARTVARDAQLQKHIPTTRLTAPCAPVGQGLQLRQRINQKPDTRLRVLPQQKIKPVQIGIGHQLVGNDGALRTCRQTHAQLVHIGKSQAPGPGLQLHAKQFGRHRGLAVRSQCHAFALHKVLHPGQVVRERRAAQHGHRIGQRVIQQMPATRAQLRHRARLCRQREALASPIQYKIVFHGSVLHSPRGQSNFDSPTAH